VAGIGDYLPATTALLEDVNAAALESLIFPVDSHCRDGAMRYRRRIGAAGDRVHAEGKSRGIGRVGAVSLGGSNRSVDCRRLALIRGWPEPLIIVRKNGLQRRAVTAGGRIAPLVVERFERFFVRVAALSESRCSPRKELRLPPEFASHSLLKKDGLARTVGYSAAGSRDQASRRGWR